MQTLYASIYIYNGGCVCHRWKSIVSGQTTLSPFINGLALPYEESRGGIRGSRYTDGGGGEAPTLGPLTRFPRKRIDQISLSQSSMSPVRKFPTPPPPPPPGHGINGHYDRAQPSPPPQPVYFTVNQRPHLCSIYIRIYLFAISVNVPSKYLRSILIENGGGHHVFILFAIPFESGRIYVQVLPGF